jgi:transcriptional regulator GlxA family with amidase domain
LRLGSQGGDPVIKGTDFVARSGDPIIKSVSGFLDQVPTTAQARPSETAQASRVSCRYVRHAKAVLDARFTDSISLRELSEIARCSRYYLSRQFRSELGLSITEYRLRLRLEAAFRHLV